MRIGCIGCCHANLGFEIEKCDILLMAGDILPAFHSSILSIQKQINWFNSDLRYWMAIQPCKEIVLTPGNHSWIFQDAPDRVPEMNSNFHYLQDSGIELMGLKIWGSPWTLPFMNWAFNAKKEIIKNYWEQIPDDTNILLLHGPPFGIFDEVIYNGLPKHIGSDSLLKKIEEIKPKLVVFAHNHDQYGVLEREGTTFINCTLLNEDYKLTKEPIYIDYEAL
ncbi:hypothetical protein LCGC14_1608690 [marine sediment metagenome]|uniref:Calcineurin-like phosphoesterase domain-containing protein n=1 Tax=marine sediment metagenome TaxID=412755 RepID=A0A0F9IVL6_9ZZZZ